MWRTLARSSGTSVENSCITDFATNEDNDANRLQLCKRNRDGGDTIVGEWRLCPRHQVFSSRRHRHCAGSPGRAALYARSLEIIWAQSLLRSLSRGGG